jgi:myo-inositol-1(or 4)-monophosphatase
MTSPNDVIEYLKHPLLIAGRYTNEVQSRVGLQVQKGGATLFHQALSDGDLTVQSYLEVLLLAKFPHLSFFSEEQDQSLNRKYFPADRHLEVLLDPIDGTRSYIDNRAAYQIIVTVHDDKEIVGAVLHMPRRELTYTAVKGEGAWSFTNAQIEKNQQGTRLQLSAPPNISLPVLCFDAADILPLLAKRFNAKDLVNEYESAPGVFNSTDVIEGKARGILHRPCQAIDGGALAFMAVEAGGVISDFDGNPLKSYRESEKRTVPNVIVAADKETHLEMVDALRNRTR